MTDEDEIIVLSPDDLDESQDETKSDDAPEETKPRRRWPLWLGVGFVVGLAVASVGSLFLRPAPFDASALDQRLMTLQAELTAARAELDELQSAPDPSLPEIDLTPIEQRLTDLEARPLVDPLNEDIVSRMEALQAEGFEIPEMPEFPDVDALNAQILALEARLLALEERPVPIVSDAEPSTEQPIYVDPATLPRFPASALRQGAAEMTGTGLLRRTLSRHVRVKGDASPDVLIDGIEEDMAAGRAEAALAKFDQLPESLQSLARGWRADMESSLP